MTIGYEDQPTAAIKDWEMDFQTNISPSARLRTTPAEWEYALEYGGRSIETMLTEPGEVYHDDVGNFLVGFRFDFGLDPNGGIVAYGKCHTAEKTRQGVTTNFDAVVSEATIRVTPQDPLTAQAVRKHLELYG